MSDLISRQAAIDAIEREKTYASAFRDGYAKINVFEKYNMGLTDGIKAIKRLPSAQQWIPCSERLPEKDKEVLVSYVGDVLAVMSLTDVCEVNVWEDPEGAWWDFEDVLAWMPLPEPYKGGE